MEAAKAPTIRIRIGRPLLSSRGSQVRLRISVGEIGEEDVDFLCGNSGDPPFKADAPELRTRIAPCGTIAGRQDWNNNERRSWHENDSRLHGFGTRFRTYDDSRGRKGLSQGCRGGRDRWAFRGSSWPVGRCRRLCNRASRSQQKREGDAILSLKRRLRSGYELITFKAAAP